MGTAANRTILRIELWHAALLVVLLGALAPARLVEPKAMLLGGLFMGVNFLLLCYGIAWILTPLASRGRVKAGVALLTLKVVLFLALLSVLFFKLGLDAISFTLGFSTLLVAIVIEAVRSGISLGT
jgi:Kef-type K+ transport system membrane component KefB